jgi:lipooligosaccharide transport system permease protein
MILKAAAVSAAVAIAEQRAGRPGSGVYAGRARTVLARNAAALRTTNAFVFATGFVEPVLFLIAFGYGIGGLVGTVEVNGVSVDYAAFIAPALLASSAMNGALMDATYNVFFKMHFQRLYQTMTSTSLGSMDVALGEIAWAMVRGAAYATGFLVVITAFGLVGSWSALLMIPAAVLVAFAFAAIGMTLTSYMSSFQQLNWVTFALLPMFLFSGTFFPITAYPLWLQHVIEALPLWQAIAMMRGLMFGELDGGLAFHVGYFVVLSVAGLWVTTRRLDSLFLR